MTSPNDAAAQICALDVRTYLDSEGYLHKPLEERLIAAFKKAQDFWMSTDMNVRFNGAVVAVYTLPGTSEEDRDRILRSRNALQRVSMAIDAARMGMSIEGMGKPVEDDIIPLLGLWNKAKEASDGKA